ncbi:MAG TPA: hypothetical protein VEZ55_07950 [Chitinophagaceae bacterium]|nr:hypothetical protein [Chitinophagaceae bacterium]
MARDIDNARGNERDINLNRAEKDSSVPNDLPDSPDDREHLRSEEVYIDLPDVSDIPGQEHVSVPPLGELADVTISSDDEEGVGIFDDEDDDDDIEYIMGTEADVRKDERQALADDTYLPTRDENNLRTARMDSTDFQGEALNEGSFGDEQTGSDLDIPGAMDETGTDALGQGDEENKHYSLGGDENDLLEDDSLR